MNTELIKHIGEGLSKTTPVCVQSKSWFNSIFFSYMYEGYKPKDDNISEVVAVWRLKPKQAKINNY